MTLYALFLTLCLAADNACHTTAPMVFESLSDCNNAGLDLRDSGQVGANTWECKELED